MDPKQEEYLRDIRDFVQKIYEEQQRQDQNHAHLTEQVESMRSSLYSQDQRLESLNEEISSLTMLKSSYIPNVTAVDTGTAQSLREKSQTSSLSQTAYGLHEIPQTEQSLTETSQTSSLSQTAYGLHEIPRTEQSLTETSQERSTSQTEHGLDMMSFSQTASSMKDIQTVVQTELAKQTQSINRLLEQERYFLKEKLGAAQLDILARLDTSQGGQGQQKDRETQTLMAISAQTKQSCCTPEKFKSEFESVFRELETSIRGVTRAELAWLNSEMTDNFSLINEQINAEITRLDTKFCTELDNKMESLGQKQSEELDRKVNDLAKKQSEQLDCRVDDLLKKQSEQLDGKLESLREKLNEQLDDKVDNIMKKQSETIENVTTKLSTELVNVTKETTREMTENVTSLSQKQREELGKRLDGVVQETKSSVSDLSRAVTNASKDTVASVVEKQKANMTSYIKEFLANSTTEILDHLTKTCDQIKTENQTQLNSVTKSQSSDIVAKITERINDCQKKAVEEINTQSKDICNKLYRLKLEIFQFTGKECQLVRDGQQPRAGVGDRKKYVCHFYVDNFKDLIKSKDQLHSCPWFINQYQTSFYGKVEMASNGDYMGVWLVHGRRAREVGLEPRSDIELKVTATVTDLSGRIKNYRVGEGTATYDENMFHNGDFGFPIGDVSCQRLLDLGFSSKEKYKRGAILIVYEIEVL